jgi:hypothetical protein
MKKLSFMFLVLMTVSSAAFASRGGSRHADSDEPRTGQMDQADCATVSDADVSAASAAPVGASSSSSPSAKAATTSKKAQ